MLENPVEIVFEGLFVAGQELLEVNLVQKVLVGQVDPGPHRRLVIVDAARPVSPGGVFFGVADKPQTREAFGEVGGQLHVAQGERPVDALTAQVLGVEFVLQVEARPLGAGREHHEVDL